MSGESVDVRLQQFPLIPAPGSGFAGPSAGSSGNPRHNAKPENLALDFRGGERTLAADMSGLWRTLRYAHRNTAMPATGTGTAGIPGRFRGVNT